jgi:DNA-nicking Smr family endonuclease
MSKRRPTTPSEEDLALFREAIGPVRRLQEVAPPPATPAPAPLPRQRIADEFQAAVDFKTRPFEFGDMEGSDTLAFLRDGYPPRTLRRLKRGLYAVQDEIDLHGMSVSVAETVLRQFLALARQRGHSCVRIVHGKGLRSKDSAAVLKQMTDHLLRHHGEVLAFASAPLAQGGTGAALVLLKPQRVGESRLVNEQDTGLPWR